MRTSVTACLAALFAAAISTAYAAPLGTPALAAGQNILVESGEVTIAGLGAVTVVRYTWRDAATYPRSVALVPASATSGYAVRFTYTVNAGANTVNVDADSVADGGFGYFVSHELFRNFGDTIASLHGEDDSPLGRYLPSTGSAQSAGTTQAAHEFRLNYPRWGTVAAMPDPDQPTDTSLAAHHRYDLPVVIRWHFVAGQNYPLWSVEYDLSSASDHIANDVRGPYGVMYFNEGVGNAVTALRWGDEYKFVADASALDLATTATNSASGVHWTWNTANTGRRYNVLSSGAYEFGLVDTVPVSQSRYGDSYGTHRNLAWAANPASCDYGMISLPCDWEWAYQSMQYEGAPSRPKLAWGASFYLGSSITSVYVADSGIQNETISPKGKIHYGLHIVLGRSAVGAPLTLARSTAAMEADPTLTVSVTGGGAISYTVLGDGTTYNATRTLKPWDSVSLVASPNAGTAFQAWSGACAGVAGNTCMITMDASRSVGATFTVSSDPNADDDGDGIPNGLEAALGRNPNVKDNDVFGNATLFAMQQYRDFLSREGDSGGIAFWASQVSGAAMTRAAVIENFFTSAEFQGVIAPVTRLYFAYFLRIPDYPGLQFWIGQYKGGMPLNTVSQNFATSPEFINRYGALTNLQFVTQIYQNVLGRAPDAPGLAFWTGQLDTAAMSRGQVMTGFSESPEYKATSNANVYVTMMYVGMLRRAPDQGGFDFWVNYLNTGNSGQALINGFLSSPEYHSRFLP